MLWREMARGLHQMPVNDGVSWRRCADVSRELDRGAFGCSSRCLG